MSKLFNFQPAPAQNNSAASDERPKSQVFINIGLTVDLPNPETGELEPVFVSLPIGIGLDTMEDMPMRGTNANWANMVQAKNQLLAALQDLGKTLEPGGERIVDELQIQVKRVGKAAEPAKGENPILAAMAGKLAVVK